MILPFITGTVHEEITIACPLRDSGATAGEGVFHRCEAGTVGIDTGEQGQDRGEESGA